MSDFVSRLKSSKNGDGESFNNINRQSIKEFLNSIDFEDLSATIVIDGKRFTISELIDMLKAAFILFEHGVDLVDVPDEYLEEDMQKQKELMAKISEHRRQVRFTEILKNRGGYDK